MLKESRLPPRIFIDTPEEALARKRAREHKDAQVRGVESIDEMRHAIRRVSRDLPAITEVPRLARLDAAAFRARAAEGCFLGSPLCPRLKGRWSTSSG